MKRLKELKTKQKDIEHILEDSLKEVYHERDRAQKYFEVADVMLLVLDVKGNATLINNKGTKILGYRKKDIIGKNWFENFIPARIRHDTKNVFRKVMLGQIKETEYHENPIISKSGKERLIAWHNAILTDENGKINGVLSSGQDITEHKQKDDDLRQSEQKFRLLAENIPGVIYLCRNDKRYTMLYLNEKIEEITGYPKQDFLKDKRSFVDLFHSDDEEYIFHEVNQGVENKKPFHLIYRLKHRSGEWRWVEEFGTGVFDENSKQLLFLEGVINDITERKQMEESIKGLSRKIIEAQDAERQKIAREIHDDLGQSLIAMKMFITNNFPQDYINISEIQEFTEALKLQLNKNIEKARNISYSLRPHTLQVLGLSMGIKILIENFECNNDLKIHYKGLKFERFSFKGEEINFYRIIQEALMNIVKHGEASEVKVAASAKNGVLKMIIQDNGKGFKKKQSMGKKNSTKSLGLSIMHERAKLLGGDLKINSQKNKGTTVTLNIPVERVKK